MDMLSYYIGRMTGVTKPRILAQPTDQSGAVNAKAYFTVSALGVNLTYQWQYSEDGGTTWATTSLTGAKTPTVTVTITAARDGFMYRCVITDQNNVSITSNAATLHVTNTFVGGDN